MTQPKKKRRSVSFLSILRNETGGISLATAAAVTGMMSPALGLLCTACGWGLDFACLADWSGTCRRSDSSDQSHVLCSPPGQAEMTDEVAATLCCDPSDPTKPASDPST